MNDIQNIMKADQPTFSIYELATLMRNCHSPQEIQSFVSNLRIEFDYYSISDQGFSAGNDWNGHHEPER